jgi:hypothetical protein
MDELHGLQWQGNDPTTAMFYPAGAPGGVWRILYADMTPAMQAAVDTLVAANV